MFRWIYMHFPIITTKKEIIRLQKEVYNAGEHNGRNAENELARRFALYVLNELKDIRKTCHKKDNIDRLIKLVTRNLDPVSEYYAGHDCK